MRRSLIGGQFEIMGSKGVVHRDYNLVKRQHAIDVLGGWTTLIRRPFHVNSGNRRIESHQGRFRALGESRKSFWTSLISEKRTSPLYPSMRLHRMDVYF
jgi:hypothetical protein